MASFPLSRNAGLLLAMLQALKRLCQATGSLCISTHRAYARLHATDTDTMRTVQDAEPPRGARSSASTGSASSSPPKPVASSTPAPREEYKVVLCVNQELKMTKGKVAAQCCHAAVAVVRFLQPR